MVLMDDVEGKDDDETIVIGGCGVSGRMIQYMERLCWSYEHMMRVTNSVCSLRLILSY